MGLPVRLDAHLRDRRLLQGLSSLFHIFLQLFRNNKIFSEAHKACLQYGAHLASVSSAAEQEVLYNLTTIEGAWIGFKSWDEIRMFQWTDGSSVSYTNWAPDEPSNLDSKESCAELRKIPDYYPGQWNDLPCSKPMEFLCKMDDARYMSVHE